MGQLVRSAKGVMVDFELLAIKQQLANAPVPKAVIERQQAIDIKDGVKITPDAAEAAVQDVQPLDEMFAVSTDAASTSAKAKQLKSK